MSKSVNPQRLFRPSARLVVVMLLSAFGLTLTPSATFAVGGILSDEASCTALGGVWAPDPDFSCTVTTLDIGSGEQLDIQVNATLIVNGVLNNEGTLRNLGTFIKNSSSGVINNEGTISNDGTFNNDGTINNSGVITNNVTGTINNSNIIDNNNSIINDGSINNNFFGVIHNNATGTLQNNSALDSNGTIDNSGAIIGAFGNTGTVNDECGTFSVEPEGAVVDQCAPTVSITAPANNATVNTATPLITGSAADARSGVQFVEIKIDAGAYELAAGTTSWSFTSSALSDGSHTITVRATDNADNVSSEQSITISVDTSAPGVSINQSATQADPTGGTPINFTVLFNEPINVASFVDSDVDLSDSTTGGTLSAVVTQIAPNDGTTFNVAVSGMESSGNVVAALAAGVVLDLAGNGNTSSASTDNTVAFDNNVPSVAMSSASSDPTNVSPIPVTVQFSENVSGFTAGDIVATNGTVDNFTAVDGDTYTFGLTPNGQGVVSADIAADVAQDATSNGNSAAAQLSVIFDNVAPSVTINQASGQADPTSGSPILFTVVFAEPVSGFTASDVNLSGSAGATTAVVSEMAPNNGTTFNVAVSGMVSGGTVIAAITPAGAVDEAGNGNQASTSTDNTVTFVQSGTPVANSATGTGEVGKSTTITLTAIDADGDPLNFTIVEGPDHGTLGALTVSCNASVPITCTAIVTYTHNGSQNLLDTFSYKVNDGTVDSEAATVTITIEQTDPTNEFDFFTKLPSLMKALDDDKADNE